MVLYQLSQLFYYLLPLFIPGISLLMVVPESVFIVIEELAFLLIVFLYFLFLSFQRILLFF
jgi:hypothetical protein